MIEWQPIKTAPKDGTVIIGWFARIPCAESVYWSSWIENGKTTGAWFWQQDGDSPQTPPTHWVPLPEPPND